MTFNNVHCHPRCFNQVLCDSPYAYHQDGSCAVRQGIPVDWVIVEQLGYKTEIGLRDLWDKAHEREQCGRAANVMDKVSGEAR